MVLFLPASVLTLSGAAVFGFGLGYLVVWTGATLGAALAFLVSRHVARDRVAGWASRFPRFGAVDRAIGRRGGKIIFLLRLSPAIPFNFSNYLFGLTAVRFWPYVVGTGAGILPGTLLYVYFGAVARAGLAGDQRTTAQWILTGVGLIATVAVTIYVTKVAARAIREQTEIDSETMIMSEPVKSETKGAATFTPGLIVLMAAAVLMTTAAVFAKSNSEKLQRLFGPPDVKLEEVHAANPDGPTFDHASWNALLQSHVDSEGWVDYQALAAEPARLDTYIATLAAPLPEAMGRDERLAYLINAYNAFTLRLILDHLPEGIDSIKDIPTRESWDAVRWNLNGQTVSLNQIEHEIIRPEFAEPRIHFALVCAAIGCPPLRNEAYTGAEIEAQLADQTRIVHLGERWCVYDADSNIVHLTRLYNWYGSDFEQAAGSILDFVARHAPEVRAALDRGEEPDIEWLDYDWGLNDVSNRE
jgi:uncharacterized membrane protein YdjX (TVP38/TMEM64 family)